MALGIMSSKARRVSDGMIMAAAQALAALSPTREDPDGALLPPLQSLRKVSMNVAMAVGRQAQAEGLAAIKGEAFVEALRPTCGIPCICRTGADSSSTADTRPSLVLARKLSD